MASKPRINLSVTKCGAMKENNQNSAHFVVGEILTVGRVGKINFNELLMPNYFTYLAFEARGRCRYPVVSGSNPIGTGVTQ